MKRRVKRVYDDNRLQLTIETRQTGDDTFLFNLKKMLFVKYY